MNSDFIVDPEGRTCPYCGYTLIIDCAGLACDQCWRLTDDGGDGDAQ